MRKLIVLAVFLVILTACQQQEETFDAVAKEAELIDFEISMVDISSDSSFVYDLELNNEAINSLHKTVEYYENGELVKTIVDSSTRITDYDKEDDYRVVVLQNNVTEKQQNWTSAFFSNSGSAVTKANLVRESEFNSSLHSGVSPEINLTIGEKTPIAFIIETNKNSISTNSEQPINHYIDRYEAVYVFSIELN
ncbi:membrane lipoprotein lipid attachment site-containing protein [Ornithinibacillus halophilus]|uniref:Uncharacterized protein n=1 Tax=Ornithinibacillus halophilus TaxID=930117 RepID=A0A1M5I318_9BACI|nr:membrane lipoprotein lipid attachment site-containing protein [Ornithinibacillus halophilus]SHG22459.1 hypothetical protein SAMN05216225_102119 [Ornithinibacillus halophilus]